MGGDLTMNRTQPLPRPSLATIVLSGIEMPLALLAFAIWYLMLLDGSRLQTSLAGVAISLLIVLWGMHWALSRFRITTSAFTAPFILFVLSAGVGVWAAYDLSLAWPQFGLVLSVIGLYGALSHQPGLDALYVTCSVLGVIATGFALAFLVGNDWIQHSAKAGLATQIGLTSLLDRTVATYLPNIPKHSINTNDAGGILGAFLPIFIPLVVLPLRREAASKLHWAVRLFLVVLAALCGGVVLFACIASDSRGAWAGVIGALGLGAVWRFLGWCTHGAAKTAQQAWRIRLLVMLAFIVLSAAFAVLAAYILINARMPGSTTLLGRLALLENSRQLARDYALLGAGLGTFEAQFSIYALLIHVGYVRYSHNIFMDLLIEQGLLGLGSYLWLVAVCVWQGIRLQRRATAPVTWFLQGALMSLGVGLIHGLVDNVQYPMRGLLFVVIPAGIVMACSRFVPEPVVALHRSSLVEGRRGARAARALMVAIPLVVVSMTWWRPAAASFHASLGAVEQARIELGTYDETRFEEQMMDQVRQAVDLDRAIAHFQRAIELDAGQITARQRLASIALARGAYGEALMHMEVVWAAAHYDDTTRMLLGDALVATGHVKRAADVVRGLRWAIPRLANQAWSRYYTHQQWQQAHDAWQTILILDPQNQNAQYWLREVEKRLTNG
jgi:hypothetical protein